MCVAISSDGRLLLTGGNDNTAKLWDLRSGKLIHTFNGHSDHISAVAVSPDLRIALTASWDGTAILWSVRTAERLRSFRVSSTWVTSAVFSKDGTRLLFGTLESAVKLVDARTGAVIRVFNAQSRYVESVAFSPDEQAVVAGGDGNIAQLWDVSSGKEIRAFSGHSSHVTSVAFAPDGHRVLTGSGDRTARLWDAATGEEVLAFTGAVEGTNVAAFSSDGRRVLTGNRAGVTTLWELSVRGDLRTFVGDSDGVVSIALSPDGRMMLTGGGHSRSRGDRENPKLWDGTGVVQLWDVTTGNNLRILEAYDWVDAVAFSPDGQRLLATGFLPSKGADADGTVARLLDAQTGVELRSFPHSKTVLSDVLAVAFSPDGRQVLTGSMDGSAKLWDAATGEELRTFEGNQQLAWIHAVALSPDGRMVLTGSIDDSAKLWSVETGNVVHTFRGHVGWVSSVAFSHDGSRILTGSWDHTVKIWDAGTGVELATLKGHSGIVGSAAFSPDDRRILTAGSDGVKLWDTQTDRELCTLVSFKDGTWAVIDSKGRFDASNGGVVEGLHWAMGDTPIELSQLKERYYDPGLLAKIMGFNKEPLRDVAQFDAPQLFPVVQVQAPVGQDRKLRVELRNQGGGIGKVQVLINGKEIAADARGPRPDPNAATANLSVDLSGAPLLPAQDNTLEVIAWNSQGYLSSRPARVVYRPPGNATARKPELWAILAGISEYSDPEPKYLRLTFPAKDAESMARALELGGDRLFGREHVHITVLSSAGQPGELAPSKANLKSAFQAAQRAQPGDVLVVYLAGHGVALQDLYAYPTQEARTLDLSDSAIREGTSVTSEEFTEWIKKIPALHQVMILDTCAAGAAAAKLIEKRDIPGDQVRALDRLKDRTGFHVLMGSAADAVSYEASRYGQGLLTYALLKGMKGAALKNDLDVDVSGLFNYAANDVEQLAKGVGGIQRPQLITPKAGGSFDIGELTAEDQKKIPLAEAKPIYLRPAIVNAYGPDHLKLAAAVRRELRDRTLVSSRGPQLAADVIYVDADEMADAITTSGTYTTNGKQISVDLWLAKEKATTHIVVRGSLDDTEGLATSIVTMMFKAGDVL
jgi:WD40 repeat protein